MLTQFMTVHLPDIHTIDQHTTAGHIIKSRDQLYQRTLAGSGTADDCQRFPCFCRKRNIFQDSFFTIRIAEIHVIKHNFFYMLSDIRNRLFLRNLILNIRCHIHHHFDTFGRNIGTGIHHKYEAEQHNRKHGMKKIFHKRHQLSHLQRTLIDHLACNKIDRNCRNIH